MTRRPYDPSGFDCIHCRMRFPWIASYCEEALVHVCRTCHARSNGCRRARAKQNSRPRTTIASNRAIGGIVLRTRTVIA